MCNATENVALKLNGANANSSKTTGPQQQPSALRRMTPLIISGYIFNTILYFLVLALLPSNLSPTAEYCPENEPNCTRRDLFAFQVVSLVNLSYLGLLGFYTFYISKRATTALPQTPQGRYFGNSVGSKVLLPEADHVNAVIVIFQGWDFVMSIFFEEHCTAIMMAHHFLAFNCGFFCLWYEVNPYYAVYVGGVTEFSSIFLAIAQTFEYYPPSSLVADTSSLASIIPAIQLFCQGMFALTFFLFRIIGWAKNWYMLCSDARYIFKNELLKRHSPGSGWFLWYLLSCATLLGGLQVFWFGEIVKKVVEM